ncbi:neoverrucotoxin subunit alpha-like [Paramacrobiotus metropolitanus]|uniref:neoverrucotoxin subunit alpha-like n=1 Tax=Paramacrobiotus metropolitanus TaxID=2943436 RepID=UPI00244656AD|nr:neoverrucotoxin subunit alpha-like [Paramacrobiotus metropolitanus]
MENVEIPTFGHPLHLGMFFDARSHCQSNISFNLGDFVDISKLRFERREASSSVTVIGSNSPANKLTDLDVDDNSALSVLTGLCSPTGSASWITDDDIDWLHEVRCTLHYRQYTHMDGLTDSQLHLDRITFPADFDQDSATHVVVALTYGVDVFTTFSVNCTDAGRIGETRVQLKKLVGRVKSVLDGQHDESYALDYLAGVPWVNDLVCTYTGDVIPKQPARDVETCLSFHKNIPIMLKVNEVQVPLFAWLKPLRPMPFNQSIITDTIKVIKELEDIDTAVRQLNLSICAKMRLNTASDDFLALFDKYCTDFKASVKGHLPDVRSGKPTEELEKLLQKHYRSSFSKLKIMKFWRIRQEEEDAIKKKFGMLFDLKIYSADEAEEPNNSEEINYLVYLRLYEKQFKYDFASVTDEQIPKILWFESEEQLDKLDNVLMHFKAIRGLSCLNEAVDFKISWCAEENNGTPCEIVAYCLKPSSSVNLTMWNPWWKGLKVKKKLGRSILVSWKFPKEIDFINGFVLKWKKKDDKIFNSLVIEKSRRKHVLSSLLAGVEYDICVTCVDVFDQYHSSESVRVLLKSFSVEYRKLSNAVPAMATSAAVTADVDSTDSKEWDKISLSEEKGAYDGS